MSKIPGRQATGDSSSRCSWQQHHRFRRNDNSVPRFEFYILLVPITQYDIVVTRLQLLASIAVIVETKYYDFVPSRDRREPAGYRNALQQGGLALQRIFSRPAHFA